MSNLDAATYIVNGVFYELFQRQATSDELAIYMPPIAAALLNPTQLDAAVASMTARLSQEATYDGAWTVSLSNIKSTQYKGLTLGNGKIALITSPVYNEMNRSIITTLFDYDASGRYANNVVDTFKYTRFHVGSRDNLGSNVSQNLNMYSGIFNTAYVLPVGSTSVAVSHDVAPMRQYPYCTYQKITLTADSPLTLDLYHDIQTPDTLTAPVFNTDTITTTASPTNPSARRSLSMFSATAALAQGPQKPMASVSAYLFDAGATYVHSGYNILRMDPTTGYNQYNVTLAQDPNDPTKYVFKMTIITCTMSDYDFSAPDVEARRVLVNVTTRTGDILRSDHVTAWAKMWGSNITVTPKGGLFSPPPDYTTAAAAGIASVSKLNQYIKMSLYNIYGAIRDDINVEVNPLNLSSVDITGQIFFTADLWLMPVLTMLKPKAARALLDYRYKQLTMARKLATANGYPGTRFPSNTDSLGYNDVYWDTMSPLYVYNTGLVAVSAWSYYRVTRDVLWLQKKGFEILQGCAEFFASILTYSDVNTPGGDGRYHTKGLMSMNNTADDDNFLANYMAYESLQFAIEATYELNIYTPSNWLAIVSLIALPVTSMFAGNTIYNSTVWPSASYNTLYNNSSPSSPAPTLALLEPLIVMTPYYSRDFFSFNPNYNIITMKDNVQFYTTVVDPATRNNVVNQLLIATVWGAIAQKELLLQDRITASDNLNAALNNVETNATMLPWDTFFNSMQQSSFNDIGVSAMYVFALLTGLGGLRVAGGVTNARFYYEQMGVVATNANIMPATWETMTITGVGNNQSTVTLTNQLNWPPVDITTNH